MCDKVAMLRGGKIREWKASSPVLEMMIPWDKTGKALIHVGQRLYGKDGRPVGVARITLVPRCLHLWAPRSKTMTIVHAPAMPRRFFLDYLSYLFYRWQDASERLAENRRQYIDLGKEASIWGERYTAHSMRIDRAERARRVMAREPHAR